MRWEIYRTDGATEGQGSSTSPADVSYFNPGDSQIYYLFNSIIKI